MMIMKNTSKIKRHLTKLSLVFILYFSVAENAAAEWKVSAATSYSKHYHVSYQSKVAPLPLNRIHSWVLHVDTVDGKPVENANISVHGGMPAHKHGLPTQPQVSEIGNGDYLVEGLKFSMTGLWQLWFDIRKHDITDKVKFTIAF